jgi:hypothetical protein
MKRFYVNGKQISESEARAIDAKNIEYMKRGDWDSLAKIQFITIINY